MTKETLEFLDWLVDQVNLSAQAPDFLEQAQTIAAAKNEVAQALLQAGGIPISVTRGANASV